MPRCGADNIVERIFHMLTNQSEIRFQIRGLRFGRYGENSLWVAIARGDAAIDGVVSRFDLVLEPVVDGQWKLVHLGWDLTAAPPPPVLCGEQFLKALMNCSARLLDTVNMWPSKQTTKGARFCLNERVIPDNVRDKVLVSFRPKILDVPSAAWRHLWDHIERRVAADSFFEVLGFDRAAVERVLPLLREVFPSNWVRAQYARAGHAGMADQFEPKRAEGWFPAYHLARTAHGAICRDPGWNYLMEIGLALEQLRQFDGAERLKQQLTKHPGTQHHVCLAADLHNRGLLKGIEPPTGTGAASNDLLVMVGESSFQVEVKEFTSRKPAKRLQNEIADKVKKLPSRQKQPVVFHAVLRENGFFEKGREDAFFEAVSNLEGDLPEGISAIVAGKRFIDSRGGRVKRDVERIVVNATAAAPVAEPDLRGRI